jgi:hypothetical protein
MRVLVACEYSGRVRDAFRKLGHDAMSCDLLPSDSPGPHYQGDIFNLDLSSFDLMVSFPPCTDLSAAGAPSWNIKQADGRQQRSIDFVYKLRDCGCKKIAIENPTGILNTVWRKPCQIINPFQFGEPFKKRTCLWLDGLPTLQSTNLVEPKYHYTSNSTRGGKLKDGSRKKSILPIFKPWDSAKDRSLTFQGIADAMANQWGSL